MSFMGILEPTKGEKHFGGDENGAEVVLNLLDLVIKDLSIFFLLRRVSTFFELLSFPIILMILAFAPKDEILLATFAAPPKE